MFRFISHTLLPHINAKNIYLIDGDSMVKKMKKEDLNYYIYINHLLI